MVPWLVSSVKSIQVLRLSLKWKQFSVIQAFQSVNELCFSKLAVFCVHSLVTVKMSWVSLSPTWKFRLYFLSQSVLILSFVVKNCFLLLSWRNQRLFLCVGVSIKTVPQLVSPATSKCTWSIPFAWVGCMSCSSILEYLEYPASSECPEYPEPTLPEPVVSTLPEHKDLRLNDRPFTKILEGFCLLHHHHTPSKSSVSLSLSSAAS